MCSFVDPYSFPTEKTEIKKTYVKINLTFSAAGYGFELGLNFVYIW
jgi:hypothetical protein